MTWARRYVWVLIVLLIWAGPYAVIGDGWQVGNGERRDGSALASDGVMSTSDLTGRWDGVWHSSRFSAGGSLTTLLTQSELSLTGEVTIRDTICLAGGTVSGSVDGDTVIFGAVFAGAVQANFVGTVVEEGVAIEGSYEVRDGTCAGDIGSWRVIKMVEPCDANGDGIVDRRDARDLLRFLLRGEMALSGYADCNKDGVLNVRDIAAIFKAVPR